jgi:nucleotide-binding universal stress UspA family protein
MHIKKILAPTDLSELSAVGIRYALDLAKTFEAAVTLYHIIDYDTLTRYGQRSSAPSSFQPHDQHFLNKYQIALSEFLKNHVCDLAPSVKITHKVELGTPDESIVELAKSEGYDLIVMSTHGKSGSRMTLGSVTEKVVHGAPCPVLSVCPPEASNTRVQSAAVSD